MSGFAFVGTQVAPVNGTASVPAYGFSADSDTGMFRATTNELAFATGGTEQMRLTSTGLGIGDSNPSSKLSVKGSVNNDDISIVINNTFDDNSSSSSPRSALIFGAASNNAYLRCFGAPADTASNHKIDLGSTAGNSFLTFSPSGSERMRIHSNGAVGIGTMSIQTKLLVIEVSLKTKKL